MYSMKDPNRFERLRQSWRESPLLEKTIIVMAGVEILRYAHEAIAVVTTSVHAVLGLVRWVLP